MKKILITRKLIKESEEKASKTFDPIFNSNDELYSQSKVIEMSKGCDGILSSLTDKMDQDTINKLPDTIKIMVWAAGGALARVWVRFSSCAAPEHYKHSGLAVLTARGL